jgi:hypothetical protein
MKSLSKTGPFVGFFFISFVFFLLLMTVRYYISTGRFREGGDDENGPKRRVLRHLGH